MRLMTFISAPFRAFFKANAFDKLSALAFLTAVACGITARILQTNINIAGMLSTIACVLIAIGFYAGTRRTT